MTDIGYSCMTTIWLINQYASTPQSGMGGRHYYFARELAKRGYNVYVIASSNHHLLRECKEYKGSAKVEHLDGFNFVWLKTLTYREAHSKKRVLNWFLFPWKLLSLGRILPEKPDAILCSSPSPIAFLGAKRLARRFGARLIFDVRDLWPLTLTELGGYSPGHPLIRFMQWVEDIAYRDSEHVVSNLKNAVEHMKTRGMEASKFSWIPNGIFLDEVESKAPLNALSRAQIPSGKFLVGYTGTLGVANALETLIEAAAHLRHEPQVAFVLVGAGKEKRPLERLVKEKRLTNVVFLDPVPKQEVQSVLACFDVCFIGSTASPLYHFGIGANKIPEYLYSGKPVIHAFSGACDPIVEANAGFQVPPGDAFKLAEAIKKLLRMPKIERDQLGNNGREAALCHFEYGALSERLASVLCCERSNPKV